MSGTATPLQGPFPPAMTLISGLAGITTIWANQNAARPIKPYLALRIMGMKTPEFEDYWPIDANGNQIVSSEIDVTLEVQCYGDGSAFFLNKLRQQLLFETSIDVCVGLGIAVSQRGQIMNLTPLLDKDEYEDRSMFELHLRYTQQQTDIVGQIIAVNGSGAAVVGAYGETATFAASQANADVYPDDGTDLGPDFEPTGVPPP